VIHPSLLVSIFGHRGADPWLAGGWNVTVGTHVTVTESERAMSQPLEVGAES